MSVTVGGIKFQGDGTGGLRVVVHHNSTENSEIVRELNISAEEFAAISEETRVTHKERLLDQIDAAIGGQPDSGEGRKENTGKSAKK